MGKPTAASARSKWLILVVVVIAAALGFAIVSWASPLFNREQPNASSEKVEKIYFYSSQWSEASGDLYIANTGADELIVSRVLVNGTLLDSTEWESFPSMLFKLGDQGALQITPSSITFKEGTAYQFTIQTVSGNSFSYTAIAESLDFTFMQTEELKILSHSWESSRVYIDLTVKNTGSATLTLDSVQVNSAAPTAYDLDTSTGANDTSAISVAAGVSKTVRIWASYTSGVKYEFAILTAGGNKYNYVTTAP